MGQRTSKLVRGDSYTGGPLGLRCVHDELGTSDLQQYPYSMYQHILAFLEIALQEQRLERRHPVLRRARGFDPRELFRFPDDHLRGDGDVLCVGSLPTRYKWK